MFTARFALAPTKPSSIGLSGMRKDNERRAQAFGENLDLAENMDLKVMDPEGRISGKSSNKHHSPSSLYPFTGKISLLDTLPSFMALSATQSATQDRPITDVWMRLAAGFMAHAALEQYFVHGRRLSNAMADAFSWGFDAESNADEGSEDWQINAMFLDDDEEIAGWTKIRNEHVQAVGFVYTSDCPIHYTHQYIAHPSSWNVIRGSCRGIAWRGVTARCIRTKPDVVHRGFTRRSAKAFVHTVGTW
jgi:hypothetical protein